MMFKLTLTALFAMFSLAGAAATQTAHTPGPGSAERKAIMDVLRVPVEKELKQKIVFTASDLYVLENWAFVGGTPQAPDGSAPNYNGTPYKQALDEGMFDNNFYALLKRTGGKWRVVKYAIGCTDVCYLDWRARYKAPKGLIPHAD